VTVQTARRELRRTTWFINKATDLETYYRERPMEFQKELYRIFQMEVVPEEFYFENIITKDVTGVPNNCPITPSEAIIVEKPKFIPTTDDEFLEQIKHTTDPPEVLKPIIKNDPVIQQIIKKPRTRMEKKEAKLKQAPELF